MLRHWPLWPCVCVGVWRLPKVAAWSYRSHTAKYSKSHDYSCLLCCVGALRDQRHVTLLPPPATVFLLELSVCIVCEAVCVCACAWEREKCCCEGWWGQGHYKGSVCAVHGTVLAGTHTHIHACTYTCQKQRLIVDTHAQLVHALQSHIVSPFASSSHAFSYLSLS